MPLSFPSSPTTNQQATLNGRTYRWTGSVWEFVSSGGGSSLPATISGSLDVAGDDYWSSVVLLLHGDALVDSSSASRTLTANSATASGSPKFGTGSLSFSGSSSYISIPGSADFGFAGDFTIETWVKFTSAPSSFAGAYGAAILSTYPRGSGATGWQLRINGTSTAYDTINLYTGTTDLNWSATININQWHHIAVCRSGSTIRAFVDGVQVGSSVTNSDNVTASSPGNAALWVGRLDANPYFFQMTGLLDEVRITKAARYTAGFTPSATAFPNSVPYTLSGVELNVSGGSGSSGSGLTWSSVPASATASGTAGQIAYDGSYFYLASAANTWVRTAMSTWSNWTPASLTGLSLWLDASDASTLYDATSGGSLAVADATVKRWQDKSGNNRHATGNAGPTRKTSAVNSLGALLFDGSTNVLSLAGNLYGANGYVTMFAVVRKGSVNTTSMIASQDNSLVSPRTYQFLRVSNSALQSIWFTAGATVRVGAASASVSANTPFLATVRIGSGGGAVSLNGTAGSVVSDVSGIQTNSENTYIGGYAFGTDSQWDGHICEVVAYSLALSDENKATVEAYLMSKWGIT